MQQSEAEDNIKINKNTDVEYAAVDDDAVQNTEVFEAAEDSVHADIYISGDTARIIDFCAELGSEVMVCGGEMWRSEHLMNLVFDAYGIEDTSIYIDIHTMTISGKRGDESHVIRQTHVDDINPEMERLTRLRRLTAKVCEETPDPKELNGLLKEAIGKPTYTAGMQLIGLICALISVNYIVGGGWQDALMAVCGIIFFKLCCSYLSDVPGTNPIILHSALAFIVGIVFSLLTYKLGFRETPYMAIIVMAFGIIPGLPLINACREVFCGRVLPAVQLFMQSFIETAVVVAGFAIAINLIGG